VDDLLFEPLRWPDEIDRAVTFLSENSWPHHGRARLSRTDAAEVPLKGDGVATFWVRAGAHEVGLVRLLDLDDIPDGSPLFDLRIAEAHRGRGVGRRAVTWLTDHLFTTYPDLHRIEATTRADNAAMQAVLAHCRYRLEGRFVEAWMDEDGARSDALSFAILRRESQV
jgi:RimJ/RimL family protein N-acetyltransferase